MGLAFTIDTPVKVARFGISSVISIIEDELVEEMREFYSKDQNLPFTPISVKEEDYRARRITAYLDLVHDIVARQMTVMKQEPFEAGKDITRYFELLPDNSSLRRKYLKAMTMEPGAERTLFEHELRDSIVAGSIDVNIMAKVDRTNYAPNGEALPAIYCDAMSALRGFANSKLESAVVFSAGYNPRLYSYVEQFPDFYPDENGRVKKNIILKVSDYRSALIQGKILAKKGIWISEFRIESGLNCGGHAFATDGMLLGVILEEFKHHRAGLRKELYELCNASLAAANKHKFNHPPPVRLTVQGGIGTAEEQNFLLNHFGVDGTGWGSPFLLVPEATNVDEVTLDQLATASKEDYFLSEASPLGVPFNNFRKSSSEQQRKERIAKGRPGSPCYKKFLSSDTEFTDQPICTASRQYQNLKLKQLEASDLSPELREVEAEKITSKDCLCEGLGVTVKLTNEMKISHKLSAVTICPGPNLAYFSGKFTLAQMTGHIYGREQLTNLLKRDNMFVNELVLYIDYLEKEMGKLRVSYTAKKQLYLEKFRNNLMEGIEYYKGLLPKLETKKEEATIWEGLEEHFTRLSNLFCAAAP